MTSNVIFYDLDGVLRLYDQDNITPDRHEFVPELVRLFNTLVCRTDALPVLVSDWRKKPDKLHLVLYGSGIFTGILNMVDASMPRAQGILRWLELNPHLKRWAVLDDQQDNYIGWNPDQLANLFLCTSRFGLRPSICRAVEDHLSGTTNQPGTSFDCSPDDL